jgi:excisionase family DNA binding protein
MRDPIAAKMDPFTKFGIAIFRARSSAANSGFLSWSKLLANPAPVGAANRKDVRMQEHFDKNDGAENGSRPPAMVGGASGGDGSGGAPPAPPGAPDDPGRPILLTLKQVCTRYGCGMTKLRELINDGSIDAIRLYCGTRTRVPVASADRYFLSQPRLGPKHRPKADITSGPPKES